MATSTVKFYQVDFNASNNCKVEALETYLGNHIIETVLDYQYVKIQPDITLKFNLDQSKVNENDFNYVKITNSDESKDYYYFIMSTR